jgi:hypothetical protein
MNQPRLPDRHTVYLTNTAWKKLKERAILEDSSATSIVAYLLEEFLKSPADTLPLDRYQERISEETTELRKRRTIYVPDRTWLAIAAFCTKKNYSVSGVIEHILLRYLGFLTQEVGLSNPDPEKAKKKTGRIEFDMGDNPFVIPLTPKEGKSSDQDE